jgi:hypothetical protein
MKTQIEFRDPQTLRLHKLHKQHIAAPDSESDEWHSFVDAQRATGPEGIPPLFITADGFIIDGGRRWLAAKLLQWPEIACIVRPEEHAAVILVESLLHSKRMTRGAVIYLALGLRKDFVESAEQRRLANLRRGIKTNENPLTGKTNEAETVKELCTRWGITDMTYGRARQVRELFDKHVDIKVEWEPKLLSGEKNLWNVLSAVGGAGADQSKRSAGVEQSQLEFWDAPFDSLKHAAPAWTKLDDAHRESVLDDWRKTAKKLPADLRAGMLQVLEEFTK